LRGLLLLHSETLDRGTKPVPQSPLPPPQSDELTMAAPPVSLPRLSLASSRLPSSPPPPTPFSPPHRPPPSALVSMQSNSSRTHRRADVADGSRTAARQKGDGAGGWGSGREIDGGVGGQGNGAPPREAPPTSPEAQDFHLRTSPRCAEDRHALLSPAGDFVSAPRRSAEQRPLRRPRRLRHGAVQR
jgi:hypothetical protein